MLFTSLHRELGMSHGPLKNEMIDAAVHAQIPEMNDLDWKKSFPAANDLTKSDVPKDIAAMANSGGGVIVYGVDEDQKRASCRIDVGEVAETYERSFRGVAVNGIHPPVLNLGFHRLGDDCPRALAIVVPPSVEVPHLIYRNDYFGAPIRNDADTVWMREPQLERLYRARLDGRRAAEERLEREHEQARREREQGLEKVRLRRQQALKQAHLQLEKDFKEARLQRVTDERVWMIGVARPIASPPISAPLKNEDARRIIGDAAALGSSIAGSPKYHPLNSVSEYPDPGLRRWVADPSSRETWREAWVEAHFDRSVRLAMVIGGMPYQRGYAPETTISSRRFEWFVADLLALVIKAAEFCARPDYEIRLGLEH